MLLLDCAVYTLLTARSLALINHIGVQHSVTRVNLGYTNSTGIWKNPGSDAHQN